MTEPIRFRVLGEPVPQGSKKAFRIKGTNRSVVVDDNEKPLKSWREAIANEARAYMKAHGGMPLDEPVAVVATFYVTKPPSLPKWRWLPWTGRDVDKLTRALLDALTAVVVRDDNRVTDLAIRKRYAIDQAPGVSVHVLPLALAERMASRHDGWLFWPEMLPDEPAASEREAVG